MKRHWTEINDCQFDIEDLKDMNNIELMVLSNECKDVRKEFVDREMDRRLKESKRSHLRLVK